MLDKTKNYKIDVSNLNTSERTALQEELFKQGYVWFEGGQKVGELDQGFLFLYDDMDIACCKERHYFNIHRNIPITVEDIYLKPNITPAQENAYKGSPRDSKPNKV